MSGQPEHAVGARVLGLEAHDDAAEEDAYDEALARCYALLARREYSTAELRARLERGRAGFEAATIEAALATVTEQGYLNDARYAGLVAEDRRSIDGWGVERIRARLERAGVERELIAATLAPFDAPSELTAACELLERRMRVAPSTNAERQRAFAMLIRQGFESDLAYDAVRQFEAGAARRV
jgi:regulatory protein